MEGSVEEYLNIWRHKSKPWPIIDITLSQFW
jgi:hypothetical protein